MKKILFIHKNGSLVVSPNSQDDVSDLEKLAFYPKVFQNLARIVQELDFDLVMLDQSDDLPPENAALTQKKVIPYFQREGIEFLEILMEENFSAEKATALFPKYIYGDYDLANSYLISDRVVDMTLAKKLGCKGILMQAKVSEEAVLSTTHWSEIYTYLKQEPRKAQLIRETKETKIQIELNLDGTGKNSIHTGLGFFDHMLEQLAKHGQVDVAIDVKGDLEIDEHHTIEDVALTLGATFLKALGSKKGIERYGFLLPMDDCLAQVAIDFGGRPELVWKADFKREKIGDMPTEMFAHFFKSFSDTAKCNLNIQVEGENEHHKIESIFKAFAKAIKMAVRQTNHYAIPSTKGVL